MKKTEAHKIILECAGQYKINLANRSLLFVFNNAGVIQSFEVVCMPRNYLHLTGVVLTNNYRSIDFYEMCIDKRLSPLAYEFSKDGTTQMKLSVLSQVMNIHKTAKMVGDYTHTKSMLVTEKLAGTVTACLGFIRERGKRNSYVPNTVLREDIRNVVDKPPKKVLAIFRKHKNERIYRECTYLAKDVSLETILTDALKSKNKF